MAASALYNDTVHLLSTLNESQLVAVHAVIVQLSEKREWSSPLGIRTEEELWEHIDHSLQQARLGLGRDADEVIDDLMQGV